MFRVESTAKLQLTVDEIEKIQCKQVATIIGHVSQLTFAAFGEDIVHQEKVKTHGSIITAKPASK